MDAYSKKQRFQKLYSDYIDEIYQYVFLRTGLQKAAAEDITQDIFMDVFKGLDRFKGICSERTWVYKIAKNKLSDYYRTYYKHIMESGELSDELVSHAADSNQDIEKYIEDKYNSQFIMECLSYLPEHYRITLLLKYVDGKSVRDIAVAADKSQKAIESILHNGSHRSYYLFYYMYSFLDCMQGFREQYSFISLYQVLGYLLYSNCSVCSNCGHYREFLLYLLEQHDMGHDFQHCIFWNFNMEDCSVRDFSEGSRKA